MDTKSLLEHIFDLQDQVISRHISANQDRFAFLCDAFELLFNIGISPSEWDTIPIEMRSLFNYFQADAVSTMVSSARLCLHGCDTDAFALMRVVIEELTILDYIASKRLYHDAFEEIRGRATRGKAFSNAFSYEKVISILDISDRRKRLWGHLSTLGSHASPPRLSLARVKRTDAHHSKVGISLDNPRIPQVLGELASLMLFAVRITDDFLKEYAPIAQAGFSGKRARLEERYEALKVKE